MALGNVALYTEKLGINKQNAILIVGVLITKAVSGVISIFDKPDPDAEIE